MNGLLCEVHARQQDLKIVWRFAIFLADIITVILLNEFTL